MNSYYTPYLLITGAQPDQQTIALEFLQRLFPNQYPSAEHPSLSWVNTAGEGIKIDTVRQLNEELRYKSGLNRRVVILLYFDGTQSVTQNALLKTLEEPPADTQLILVTSQLTNLLPTVISRCQIVNLIPTTITSDETSPVTGIYQALQAATASECIELAEQFSDREEALKVVNQLITHLDYLQHQEPTWKLTKHLQSLLVAHHQLKQNINVKLVMESAFFQISKSSR